MNISLIIPVHNRLELSKKCIYFLNNLIKNDTISPEVNFNLVVVDDGSNDGTAEWITSNYSSIHLLKGDGNLWWSGSVNKGVRYAISVLNSDFVLLWNNDIVPSSDYFANLVSNVKENPNFILGSLIIDSNTDKVWSKGGRFNVLTGKRSMFPERIAKGRFTYEWLTGMGTLIPVNIIERIGFWDNVNFPQYHGDFDFTLRANKSGYEIKVCKNLIIFNDTRYSSDKGFNFSSFINSLKGSNLRSRYNISKDILIYRKHCIGPLWIFSFIKKYLLYTYSTFFKSR